MRFLKQKKMSDSEFKNKMPANKFPTATLLVLSLIMALCISAQSQSYYSHYRSFDSKHL